MRLLVALAVLAGGTGCGGEEENEPPQILPAQNPIAFGNFAPEPGPACPGPDWCDPCDGFRPCTFDLQLQNIGNQPLVIDGVEVRGDTRCAVPTPPVFETGGQTATIDGHGSIFLHLEYTPGGATPSPVGMDQIAMVISSNASDYPRLDISICACVIDTDPAKAPECRCNLEDVSAQGCDQ